MIIHEIQNYWNQRALHEPERATTNDVFLRELEAKTLIKAIKDITQFPRFICDAGCGDGKTTLKIAKAFPESHVFGFDYSEAMIELAMQNQNRAGITNCRFEKDSIEKQSNSRSVDVVTCTRVLINLPTMEEQHFALRRLMDKGRFFVGIENFVQEQINFELLREKCGLHRILVHGHNVYLEEAELVSMCDGLGLDCKVSSFANAYYYATRIVYANSCRKGEKPDYLHPIHLTAIDLPEIPTPAIAPMKLFTVCPR